MLQQHLIESHAARMAELASEFSAAINREVSSVAESVSREMHVALDVRVGSVRQTRRNSTFLSNVEGLFCSHLEKSGYYPTLVAFASEMAVQAEEFKALYSEMGSGLPQINFGDEDLEVLSNQAAVAFNAMEGETYRVVALLRRQLAHSLGEVDVSKLTKGVSEDIRRLTKVVPIFSEQLILFFRIAGNLVYRSLEASGEKLSYSYVGSMSEDSREFCSALLKSNRTYTLAEISEMDNGQVGSAMDSCGGYGCKHWWAIGR